MNEQLGDLLVAAGFFGLLLAAYEVGVRLGLRRRRAEDTGGSAQIGAIQGAILGLLGLLLGFSFAAAGSRFLERQDLIVTEANAIGTTYLRAELLDEQSSASLKEALRAYTVHRIGLSSRIRSGIGAAAQEEIARLHSRMWSAALHGVEVRPAFAVAVLDPVNQVIDLHSVRMAAARKHLPLLVMGLLVASSALALGVIGYGCGVGGRRRTALTAALIFLVGTALWITYDLDHPRGGLLQLNDGPLKDLKFEKTSP